jgi:hypothetical protein
METNEMHEMTSCDALMFGSAVGIMTMSLGLGIPGIMVYPVILVSTLAGCTTTFIMAPSGEAPSEKVKVD